MERRLADLERRFGPKTDIRPARRPGLVSVVIVPAPAWVEEASEDERAAWREREPWPPSRRQ